MRATPRYRRRLESATPEAAGAMHATSNGNSSFTHKARLEARENSYACSLEALAAAADQVAQAAAAAQMQKRDASFVVDAPLRVLAQSGESDTTQMRI